MLTKMMEISKEKTPYHEFIFKFEKVDNFPEILEFCRAIKEQYTWKEFSFDLDKKGWVFSKPVILSRLYQRFPQITVEPVLASFVEEAKAEMDLQEKQRLIAQDVKLKEVSTLEVLGLKQPLYNYQRLGVEFLTASGGRAILADAPGVGKTAQALGFITHNKIAKTLVVCPASVKYAWENEVHKWTKLKPLVIDRKFGQSSAEELIEKMAGNDIFIINYDLLKKYLAVLQSMRFDCMVVDEFHAIKNLRTQRTKLVKIIAARIKHLVLLSGTPMLNRPEELFSGLSLLDPKTWNSWMQYIMRYCGAYRGRWGWDTSGATNLGELRTRISPYFLRRVKEDVLKELPPKSYINVPVELDEENERLYKKAESSLAAYLRDYKNKNTVEVKRAMAAEKLVKLNALRQITSSGKMAAAEELIDQLIENQEKVIVFSVYNEPLEYFQNKYGDKAVSITGKTSVEDRGRLVNLFQTDNKIQIFLGGTKAAGIGITLTAASNVIFLDYDWTPAIMEQAADRAHRIGQEAESVNIYQIYAKDTLDDYMERILEDKRKLVDMLIEGKDPEEQETSTVEMIFKNLEKKYE